MCSESESLLQSADLGFGGVVTSACVDLTSRGSVKRRQKKRDFSKRRSASVRKRLIFQLKLGHVE